MNIYIFELKAQLKNFLIWTGVIFLFYITFMTGVYPIFRESADQMLEVVNNFPPEFIAAFGLDLINIFSYAGFYSFTFGYLSLIGAIMASGLSIASFAREKRSKCSDFLLTKPVKRGSVFLAKLLSNLTVLIVSNILFVTLAIALYFGSGQDKAGLDKFVLACAALFFTQMVFLSAGILYATAAKKVRSVSGAATAFGFTGFILSALYGILEKEELRYVAPLKYFDPAAVFSDGGYELKYVLTAALVIVVCVTASLMKFTRGDTHAV